MIALVVLLAYIFGSQGSPASRAGLTPWGAPAQLGVVEVTGPILDATSILKALETLQNNQQVKAIVVRIESPGGAVGASQEIYRAIQGIPKPVVASMGNIAASGGYYIAAACDVIVCNPGTLTGSIGVITTLPNLEALFDKLGIKFQTLTSGAMKGAGQSDRPLTPQEKAMFQALIADLHSQFVNDVAKGRNMEVARVGALADGRVFTGQQALANGLVDVLGNYNDALKLAAEKAGLQQVPEIIRPQDEGGFWQLLAAKPAESLWRQFIAILFDNSIPRYMLPLRAE